MKCIAADAGVRSRPEYAHQMREYGFYTERLRPVWAGSPVFRQTTGYTTAYGRRRQCLRLPIHTGHNVFLTSQRFMQEQRRNQRLGKSQRWMGSVERVTRYLTTAR